MKLTDMKVSRTEAEKVIGLATAGKAGGAKKVYPYGLEILLDAVALERLGMKDLPGVGAECMVHGVGEVTEVSQREAPGGKTKNVTIQLQKLAISHKDDGEEAFKRGFGKGVKRKGY